MDTQTCNKQNYYVGICLLLCLLFTQCSSENKTKEASIYLEKEAQNINRQCPAKIDAVTSLDSCAHKQENILVYYYTVNDTCIFDKSDFEGRQIPNLIEIMKTSPEMSGLRNYNTTINHRYNDRNGKLFYSFSINPQDYK